MIVVKLIVVDRQRLVHWQVPLQPEPQRSVGEIVTPPSRYRGPSRSSAVLVRLLYYLSGLICYVLSRLAPKKDGISWQEGGHFWTRLTNN